jgi:hypothetical protein
MNTSRLVGALAVRGKGVFKALHHTLAGLGLLAAIFLTMLVGERLVVDGLGNARGDAAGPVRYDGKYDGATLVAVTGADSRHRALATFLSKRYRVAQAATQHLVGVAFDVGEQVGLDPLLILAVMAVESRLNPIAESEFGAKGLMQVIPKYHQDKVEALGGEDTVLDPFTNVMLGARILKEYIRRTGNLESGLQFYNGALADTSSEYAQKVIAEQQRLRQALQRTVPGPRPSAV